MQAVEIVRIICKGVIWNDPQNQQLLKKAFFKAATLGISKFVQEIIAAYKGSVYWEDENKHTIFHVAVLHRRAEVFNLIYSSTFKSNWLGSNDNIRNNILHFGGKLVPSSEVAGAALQMQRKLEWFKAVENLVHPFLREAVNNEQTPREVFTEEHKELVKEGEKWMKETATACSVVAAFIITVMFAAAFTVPVLMFLGILTSRYSEEDFLLSLPRKLIIDLITMFFSIASMMVSFGATIYLVLFSTWKWVFIPITLVGCVPVTLFALLQFPLLFDMYSSTYGRGIFGRK
ncbi:ANK REP REGION domain-containing protein [Citrus sinensis]|uniref:ANK REP REGION domain-containing protein n=1 Tax=Citrus sinensis TaxID=2711 RepID=A0ACB8K8H9_CITSI|nr:ANK REP REGION domain-containing protein [Citrus sinensis]